MNDMTKIKIMNGDAIETFHITDPAVDDGIGWDSAGNDAPHDGQGIGHEAGDHTGHGRSLLNDSIEGLEQVTVPRHASFTELLATRQTPRRRA